jgi:hypothetical protein
VPSWLWLYGSWIYNYLINQCPSLMWVWIPLRQGVPDFAGDCPMIIPVQFGFIQISY